MVSRDLVGRFAAGAVAAGAEVVRAPDLAAALAVAARLFAEAKVARALASRPVQAEAVASGLAVALPEDVEAIAAADAALVSADFGAAETGTLVRLDEGDEEKLAWTLPPLCVCLLDCGRIVPDLQSLAGTMADHLARPGIPGPQVSLVTGPSRTADIENQLTIGVQGPARLVVVLVGGKGGWRP
ncbi:MAG TPA: LUD domain-containing protein [Terriglobales bacterium]|nr:LUD domain-containing protein [Terriglobales bacterium]